MNRLELYPGAIITDRYGPIHIYRKVTLIDGDVVFVAPVNGGRHWPIPLKTIESHWRLADTKEIPS